MKLKCPECGEPAQRKAPTGTLPAGQVDEYSHMDGEPLCPVVGDKGYESAKPVRA